MACTLNCVELRGAVAQRTLVWGCCGGAHAYPNGGGAYVVSRANLRRDAALAAISALLVDYVLAVAVWVAAGVANIVSAFPVLAPHAVGLSLDMVALLTVANLRGVKESGTAFAIPTYGFVVSVFAIIGLGVARILVGYTPVAEVRRLPGSAGDPGLLPCRKDEVEGSGVPRTPGCGVQTPTGGQTAP